MIRHFFNTVRAKVPFAAQIITAVAVLALIATQVPVVAARLAASLSQNPHTQLTPIDPAVAEAPAMVQPPSPAVTPEAEAEEEGDDPDMPARFRGRMDESDYNRRRDEFVALLRGVDPNEPADSTARTRANLSLFETGSVRVVKFSVPVYEPMGASEKLESPCTSIW